VQACKALAVYRVVHFVEVFLHWGPAMSILRYLDPTSWGEGLKGLAIDTPVNVVARFLCPYFCDVRVMVEGTLDDVFLVATCRCCHTGVLFNLFG